MADEKVVIQSGQFDAAAAAIAKGMRLGIREIGEGIRLRARQNIVQQNAVDTGALLNSVYVEGGEGGAKNERDTALVAAREAAAVPGAKSGRTHGAPAAVPGDKRGSPSRCRVAVAVEYGVYIECGTTRTEERPFLFPAVSDVKGKADGVVRAHIAERLKEVLGGGG